MAKTKQAKINQLSTENQNNETIRVVIKAPLKTRKRSKCYDLSSKAQLVIVDGDIKNKRLHLQRCDKKWQKLFAVFQWQRMRMGIK